MLHNLRGSAMIAGHKSLITRIGGAMSVTRLPAIGGEAMSAHRPYYPPLPTYYRGVRLQLVYFRADPTRLRAFLPEPLEPAVDGLCVAFGIDVPFSSSYASYRLKLIPRADGPGPAIKQLVTATPSDVTTHLLYQGRGTVSFAGTANSDLRAFAPQEEVAAFYDYLRET